MKYFKTIILIFAWLTLTSISYGHASHTHEAESAPISVHQIIGGIGYIIGIFGLLAYWKSRKPKDPS